METFTMEISATVAQQETYHRTSATVAFLIDSTSQWLTMSSVSILYKIHKHFVPQIIKASLLFIKSVGVDLSKEETITNTVKIGWMSSDKLISV